MMIKRLNFKVLFFFASFLLTMSAMAAENGHQRMQVKNQPSQLNIPGYSLTDADALAVSQSLRFFLPNGCITGSFFSPVSKVPAARAFKVKLNKRNTDDGILKILAIGNSFSQDALEYYLYGLAKAAGKKIIIGNLYIGGATLKQHMDNAIGDKAAYDFRKITVDGIKTNTPKTSIATALASENWDFISFQQASTYSGQYATFITPLTYLYNYVKAKATNPDVKYILHQTWAYAQTSTHAGFANYNKDQLTMYRAIVATYKKARKLIQAAFIVPDGTAVQNGRTSLIGDNYNRDGYHLDVNIGRYTASCTWFERLFGETVIGNSFTPPALTPYEVRIAQHAAHFAVQQPDRVTKMVDFQGGGNGHLVQPVYVSFGKNPSAIKWNTVTSPLKGTTLLNLKDAGGNYVGVSLRVVEGFNHLNTNGAKATTTDFNMPAGVSSDTYYGNASKVFEGNTVKQSVLKFSGLDRTEKYNFCFFSSRMHVPAGEIRETKFVVKGQTEHIALLDAANNTAHTACATDVKADANGVITLTITAGEHNTNAYGFYYLNALRLTPVTDKF